MLPRLAIENFTPLMEAVSDLVAEQGPIKYLEIAHDIGINFPNATTRHIRGALNLLVDLGQISCGLDGETYNAVAPAVQV